MTMSQLATSSSWADLSPGILSKVFASLSMPLLRVTVYVALGTRS